MIGNLVGCRVDRLQFFLGTAFEPLASDPSLAFGALYCTFRAYETNVAARRLRHAATELAPSFGRLKVKPTGQNTNRRPNCIRRIGDVDGPTPVEPARAKIWPVVDPPIKVFGFARLAWLRTLKLSQRSCSFLPSDMWNCFHNDQSAPNKPGPRMVPRPALPQVNGAGAAKAEESNQRLRSELEML